MIPALELLEELPLMVRLRARLGRTRPGKAAAAGGLWGSFLSLVAAALAGSRRLLILTADEEAARDLQDDLVLFGLAREECGLLPVLDDEPDPAAFRGLLMALQEIRRGVSTLLVPLPALARPLPDPGELAADRTVLRTGDPADPEALLAAAVKAGFRRVPLVAAPGQASLRGDILDIFPFSSRHPLRLESLDGVLESLRLFDPESQRSLQRLTEAELLLLPRGSALPRTPDGEDGSAAWLAAACAGRLLLAVEPALLAERRRALAAEGEAEGRRLEQAEARLAGLPSLALQALPAGGELDFSVRQVPPPARGEEAPERLVALALEHTLLACRTEADRGRLLERLGGQWPPGVECVTGRLGRGFRVPELGLAILSHDELEGLRPLPRPARGLELPARALKGFYELKRLDLVVHAVHGIARFLGIKALRKGETVEDHLELEFAGNVSLYVPVSRIELVQKYVGSGQSDPPLDRLGGRGFAGRKEAVRLALRDMAAELLEIQARRAESPGHAFPPDDEMQRAFEADFPFRETPDQAKVMEEIRLDMLAARPMDRLICGDVGFGKTELAMRAAFKAALGGKQVALLVPTTILAQQHFETFRARMADWPVRIGLLSRFRSPALQARTLEQAKSGTLDILIGTHRLLSADVHFSDLGLVIIDEEQRFGVAAKEKLKRLRATVDVLTLTATPIPRTLHMSLVGLRDISALTTPPTGRQEVATLLRPRSALLIQQGIRRELLRGGQVFFLHNRVQGIDAVERELASLVPEARIVVGHGQMPEQRLEQAMARFVAGEADVLLSTSIIESGLDIPRANTIFIDKAHLFGLADLHQLRGRVGRYRHKAYAYLLYDPLDPPRGDAALRLKALEELSGLGAGFAIAMRDLEIRGAGNILGAQQSGHIAAVGYDMYCRLLKAAAAGLSGAPLPLPEEEDVELDLGVPAFIPPEYIREEELRIEALRSMERAAREGQAGAALAELADRYGPPPEPVRDLARLFGARRRLLGAGVRELRFDRADRLVLRHPPGGAPTGAWLKAFPSVRRVGTAETHLLLPPGRRDPAGALAFLEGALGLEP